MKRRLWKWLCGPASIIDGLALTLTIGCWMPALAYRCTYQAMK